MRKFILFSLTLIMIAFCAASCSKSEIEVPDGLQIVKVSQADGYQFFGPEGWVIANDGDIAATYVSGINNTSITFAEADAPGDGVSVQDYFESEKSKFSYDINIVEEKETKFGNAESAYQYIYTFKYKGYDFAVMQIFVKNAGRFYIFTYTSYGDPKDENSDYQYYITGVKSAIDNFKFTKAVENTEEKPSSVADSDGYVLVSEKKLSGFELYVPKDAQVLASSIQVTAKLSDGANINITKASGTGVTIVDYLKTRKSELKAIFGDISDIKIELAKKPSATDEELSKMFESFDVPAEVNENLVFGNIEKGSILSYEYTYTHNGETYHVYQIMGIKYPDGYVLTYTATEDEYALHLDTLAKILEKVKF